ncbi:MAG: ATP-binding protein [Candidatus Babeliales bacterium]
MKRTIDYFLLEWKQREGRKPLLLRGARQIGKTHAIRTLGKSFPDFVEINLELNEKARNIVEKDLDPHRIIQQLSELLQRKITPGSTLLFFDEIQRVPSAIIALRYFYELIPELHVAAAGSLLDFAIQQVGLPVGRVSTLYMYPMSFIEFLVALGHHEWARLIATHGPENQLSEPLHETLLSLVGIYLAIGGMPEAIKEWIKNNTSWTSKIVHSDLIYGYQQDFGKYAKQHQIKYLNLLFQEGVDQLSKKFMYSRVGEYQKRELQPALELLEMAGLVHKVTRSSGQGIPLGAQADLDDFKLIFLDIGLSQALLKLDLTPWLLEPLKTFINKGEIVEAFVGQEILAYSDPISRDSLFYWHREKHGSDAEIDYLVQIKNEVVPIEVKAGGSKRIKSVHLFLDSHQNSSYGMRFFADNYSLEQRIASYPLYSVAKPFLDVHERMRNAVMSLVGK